MRQTILLLTLVGAALLACTGVVLAQQTKTLPEQAGQPDKKVIPNSYIVVLNEEVRQRPRDVANAMAQELDLRPKQIYENALRGFAADLSDAQRNRLSADPRVAYVEEDYEIVALQDNSREIPTGYERIRAKESPTSQGAASGTTPINVGVAVIDTGIDLQHPDLTNARHGTNAIEPDRDTNNNPLCAQSSTKTSDDDGGHGTHVAGTIGALPDTTNGVLGVASGTPLYAVKVLNSDGTGALSWILCGIDYVTANKDTIKVANMSLGGGGKDSSVDSNCRTTKGPGDSYHEAICRSVKAGVTYTVAAGNGSTNFQTIRPAAYDEVLTVTNVADYDGVAGGLWSGPDKVECTDDVDDTARNTSNYTSTRSSDRSHTIAAPGTCIKSTWPTNLDDKTGYALGTGTSMAAPHVAGAAALIIANNPGLAPAQVKEQLINYATEQSSLEATWGSTYTTYPTYWTDPYFGFNNDPNYPNGRRYYGYLLSVKGY